MPYKLLLADDSLTIQKVIEIILAPEGFEIKAYNDGEQALQGLKSFTPDIVLADVEMPALNGYQLCEKIRKGANTSRVPVILLAGAFEPFDENHSKEVGADEVIIKPFESRELIDKVKATLSKSPAFPVKDTQQPTVEPITPVIKEQPHTVPPPVAPKDIKAEWKIDQPAVSTPREVAGIFAEKKVVDVKAPTHEAAEKETHKVEEFTGFDNLERLSQMAVEAQRRGRKQEEPKTKLEKEAYDNISHDIDSKISEQALSEITISIKESVEKAVSAAVPQIVEKVSREVVSDLMGSLKSEVQTIIKKSVPEVAETLIKKEIEKITTEL